MAPASGPAGRKTPATPHASAAAPITTASVSRTAERPGRIRERLPARAGYIFGAGHFDSNSVAHTVGQTLARSEEHTSELQSPCNLACRLLLEKQIIPTTL